MLVCAQYLDLFLSTWKAQIIKDFFSIEFSFYIKKNGSFHKTQNYNLHIYPNLTSYLLTLWLKKKNNNNKKTFNIYTEGTFFRCLAESDIIKAEIEMKQVILLELQSCLAAISKYDLMWRIKVSLHITSLLSEREIVCHAYMETYTYPNSFIVLPPICLVNSDNKQLN